jgi:hypothetical protein
MYRLKYVQCIGLSVSMYRRVYVRMYRLKYSMCSVSVSVYRCIGVSMYLCIG